MHSQVNPSTELRTDLIYTVEFLCQEWVALPVKEYQENLVLQLQRMISRLPWLFSSLHPLTQDFLISTMHQSSIFSTSFTIVAMRLASGPALSLHFPHGLPVIPRFGLLCRRSPGHRPELHRFFSVFFKDSRVNKKTQNSGSQTKVHDKKSSPFEVEDVAQTF